MFMNLCNQIAMANIPWAYRIIFAVIIILVASMWIVLSNKLHKIENKLDEINRKEH